MNLRWIASLQRFSGAAPVPGILWQKYPYILTEISGILKTNPLSNLEYFQSALIQELLCVFDPLSRNRIHDSLSCFLTEKAAEVSGADVYSRGYLSEC